MCRNNNNKRLCDKVSYSKQSDKFKLIDSSAFKILKKTNILQSNELIGNFASVKTQTPISSMSKIESYMYGPEILDRPYDKIVERDSRGRKIFPSGTIFSAVIFKRSQDTGNMIGFISTNPVTKQVRGVSENSEYPKSLVVVHKSISPNIIPGKLYRVAMVPMHKKQGYIVIDAEIFTYNAKLEVEYAPRSKYIVKVKFGNRTIVFDPLKGKKLWQRTLAGCKDHLMKHLEIRNISDIIDEFIVAANHIIILLRRDGIYYKESEIA